MKLVVSRTVPEADWNLDVLLNVVEQEINARERGFSDIDLWTTEE